MWSYPVATKHGVLEKIHHFNPFEAEFRPIPNMFEYWRVTPCCFCFLNQHFSLLKRLTLSPFPTFCLGKTKHFKFTNHHFCLGKP